MTLVRLDDVSLEFGDQILLKQAAFAIEPNERVCLIGRNGAGKTSLLKLISGALQPDHGELQWQSDVRISQLAQTLPSELHHQVREHVALGMQSLQTLIDEYHRLADDTRGKHDIRELEALEQRIEAHGGWRIDQRVDAMITQLDLPAERMLSELSGGWRRRVALARALVSDPDLLLLDEPTNHLDLSTIDWLEKRVGAYPGSVLFITHDRAFMQRLATRIVELDRGKLTSWPGDYRRYLRDKERSLEEERRRNAEFDKKLAQEEDWIRQGIKARRKRNEGRVRALQEMRDIRAQRVKPQHGARISVEEAEQSGRKVIEARNIKHGYHGQTLIDGVTLKIMRGDRIGLIGNNGVGKSTLLRILLGELAPQQGTVKLGTNIQIGYFDQLRRDLDPTKTVAETVGDGRDYIRINGKERHIIGYLRGFLFSAKRAMSPVRALSGGECNRLILARLFTRPSNLLVLDEPTNDLDVETLEVLEARLAEYRGTLIVVSHDREFLDNVVTSTLVFEPGGRIVEYMGGYSDWARRGRRLAEMDTPSDGDRYGRIAGKSKPRSESRKLSYKQQLELDRLPGRIEDLEEQLAGLQERIADPDFYNRPYAEVQPTLEALKSTQEQLDGAVDRWSELEELQQALERATRT